MGGLGGGGPIPLLSCPVPAALVPLSTACDICVAEPPVHLLPLPLTRGAWAGTVEEGWPVVPPRRGQVLPALVLWCRLLLPGGPAPRLSSSLSCWGGLRGGGFEGLPSSEGGARAQGSRSWPMSARLVAS